NLGQNSSSIVHCAIAAQISPSRNQIKDTSFYPLLSISKPLTKRKNLLGQTAVRPTLNGFLSGIFIRKGYQPFKIARNRLFFIFIFILSSPSSPSAFLPFPDER
ncbi:MAG: hypothetical protein LBI02_04210, partial [Opitutaceae bacterium]|nr:hypothetical protein [Opitutaceae bacterium]